MSLPPVGGSRTHASVSSALPPPKSSNPQPSSSLRGRQVSPISLDSGSPAKEHPLPGQGQSKGAIRRRAKRDAETQDNRQQAARQLPSPPQNVEGAGVVPTPPRDGHEAVDAEKEARSRAKLIEFFGEQSLPNPSVSRDRPLPTPLPADGGAGGGAGGTDGDGWRFWRWAGRTGPRPAAPAPAAPAGGDGPPPSWLDWMRSPLSSPIPPKAPAPKLGLADFPKQDKKDDLKKKMTDKTECLEPLADMFMYRDTLLKSIRSALTVHAGNPKLLDDNSSEIEKAMKQELAFKELCECGLEEYRWKPWPRFRDDAGVWRISPEVVKTTEKLHEECIKKQGDLDRLEGSLLAELQEEGLYTRPKPSGKPEAPEEPLVKKVVDFLGKHPWLTVGSVGSFLFALRDMSWMPVAAPIAVGISIDGAGAPKELAEDIKALAKEVFKSSPSAALPIGAAVATTAYLNRCDHFLGLAGYNFLTPGQLFGLAGITNLIAISNFMEGVNWVLDELPSICSEKVTRIPYIVFRGGYRTGIASAALGGALSNYFDASKTVTVSFMTLIWATHVAASYAIYQSELRNAAV